MKEIELKNVVFRHDRMLSAGCHDLATVREKTVVKRIIFVLSDALW